jgi:hypothetical protein
MVPLEIIPLEIVPREIVPREIFPLEIFPREIVPREIVPRPTTQPDIFQRLTDSLRFSTNRSTGRGMKQMR